MHKAWSSIGGVPYCFQGHPSNFNVTQDQKSPILTVLGHLRTVTPVWIDWWLRNDARSLKQHRRGALLFLKVLCQILWSHRTMADFLPNWAFPDCNSNLNWPMNTKWYTKLEAVVFQGHPSNFKVTNFTQIEHFRTVLTPVLIHLWLWNNGQSLT